MSESSTAEAQAPTAEETAESAPAVDRIDDSADLAQRLWERHTTTGAAALKGGDLIPRKRRTFLMDGASCAPFFYWDVDSGEYLDFKVTMQSLTSLEEMNALNGVTDPGQVPYLLAKMSLYAINGKPIPRDRKDFYWESFGSQGRQIALMCFQMIGSASGVALGKFQRSISAD